MDELRNNFETCLFSASADVLASLRAAAGRLIANLALLGAAVVAAAGVLLLTFERRFK